MRIAYVCADPGIPVFGQKGASIHVQEVIRALQRQGAVVELFASRVGGLPPADLVDLDVRTLPPIPKGEISAREQAAFSANLDLRLALEQTAPFDLIYERYSLWSYSAMEFAQSVGIPGLLEVNAPLIEEQSQHRGLVNRDRAEQVAERVFCSASHLIAVSQDLQQYLMNWDCQRPVYVIPNGVNRDRFSTPCQPTWPHDPNAFTLGFVGSLKPWHGLTHLVNAFSNLHQRIPQARLLIVGDGPLRTQLEGDLAERGLQSHAHFTGAVLPQQIPGLLASMTVAIAPYPNISGFYFSPLKVVEYMAAGLPVVASRIGQLAELVDDGRTGCLCPPGDESALVEVLEQLWRSPDLRHRLGQAARQHVLTHHTWDRVAEQILAIAQEEVPLQHRSLPSAIA